MEGVLRFDDTTQKKLDVSKLTYLDPDQAPSRWYLCALCEQQIAAEEAVTTVVGSHEHVFTNPAGYVYRIGCFKEAPGCGCVGKETTEHTWFAGYAWSISLCRGCTTHLGWRFAGEGANFFGLILDRLKLPNP